MLGTPFCMDEWMNDVNLQKKCRLPLLATKQPLNQVALLHLMGRQVV